MRRVASLAAALLALALGAAPANATVISGSYAFVATNFADLGAPTTPPYATVVGMFTITFDNATPVMDATSGLSAALDIPVSSAVGYDYFSNDILFIGGILNGVDAVMADTQDFILVVSSISTVPDAAVFLYTSTIAADASSAFETVDVTLYAAPEPASAALLAAGLGGLGMVRRRRTV